MSVTIKNISGNWITPEEQLMALMPSKVATQISLLHRKDSLLDTNLINSITNYFIDRLPQMTYWYTALKRLDLLPDLVPPLPENFYEIYFGDCPIRKKEDGEPYKLYATHSLYLIPKMSLKDLESRVEASVGVFLTIISLRHRYYHNIFHSIESDQLEWVLIPNEVFEESRNQTFSKQLETLKTLNQKITIRPNYKLAFLKEIATFLLFHKLATDECLYEMGNAQNGNRSSYVRVQETDDREHHLEIGGSVPWGVFVDSHYDDFNSERIGLGIVRKFSN